MSVPSNRMVPDVGSMSRSISRPTVVLPEPDSPTRPSVSPWRISKLTPDTACTLATTLFRIPPRMGKSFTRSMTWTSGVAGTRAAPGSTGVVAVVTRRPPA